MTFAVSLFPTMMGKPTKRDERRAEAMTVLCESKGDS
jgi:hypothetical protein